MAHKKSRVESHESGVRSLAGPGRWKASFFLDESLCYVIARYAGQQSLMSNNICNLTCPIICPTLSIPGTELRGGFAYVEQAFQPAHSGCNKARNEKRGLLARSKQPGKAVLRRQWSRCISPNRYFVGHGAIKNYRILKAPAEVKILLKTSNVRSVRCRIIFR